MQHLTAVRVIQLTGPRRTTELSPNVVAPTENKPPSARKKARVAKGSSNKGEAQRRYQREALLARSFLRDNLPKEFAKIAKQVGRRRPTFKIGDRKLKSKKESGNNATKNDK